MSCKGLTPWSVDLDAAKMAEGIMTIYEYVAVREANRLTQESSTRELTVREWRVVNELRDTARRLEREEADSVTHLTAEAVCGQA